MCEPVGAALIMFVASRVAVNAASASRQAGPSEIEKPAKTESTPPKEKKQHKEVIVTHKANGNKVYEFIY